MGRSLQPLRFCNLCEFSTRNKYFFKRHINFCRRRNRNKEFLPGSLPPPSTISEDTMASTPELEEVPVVVKNDTSSQEIQDIDEASMDMDDGSLIESSPMNQSSYDEYPEISGSSSSGGILPPPNVCRNYHCQECSFTTTKSKMFLYHQIDVHGANFNVFPCDFCEYASRWKHKLLRHKEKAHKATVTMEELQPEYTATKTSPAPSSPKPKKPSPARYTISNRAAKLKRSRAQIGKNNNLDSCSMYIEKLNTNFNGSSVFKCKLCLYTSKTRMQAYKHVYSCHIKAKVFKCKLCNFSTEKKIDFYIHKSKHTNENFYQCKECLYGTTLKTNYDRHMLNHEMTSAFTCNLCTYSSPNEGALKRHLTNHHSNSEENVSLIVSSTSTAAADTKPRDVRDSTIETFSPETIVESAVPTKFVDQIEKEDDGVIADDDEDEEDEDEGNRRTVEGPSHHRYTKSFCYRCLICGLKYKRSPDMNRHMKLKHNICLQEFKKLDLEKQYRMLNSVDKKDDANDNGYEDDYGAPLDLSIKTMRSVFNVSKTKLKCTYCSYIAKWPCDLRRHMAVHSIDKRYKCHLCMRKYKYFGDLNVHVRRDHDIEPDKALIEKVTTVQKKKSSPTIFKCPSCSFTSSYKSEIDRHSKLHDGNKPYKCKLCKYQSHWKGDMNRHLYRHHPSEVQQEEDIKNLVIYQKIINSDMMSSTKSIVTPSSSSTSLSSSLATTSCDTSTVSVPATVATITSTSTSSSSATTTSTTISIISPISSTDDNKDLSNTKQEETTDDKSILPSDCGSDMETSKLNDETPTLISDSSMVEGGSLERSAEGVSTAFADISEETNQKEVLGPFLCNYCDFSAPAPSKLKAHLATHWNLKKFKCPICGKRSNWKWDIRKHIRKEHPGQNDDVIVMSEQEAEATVLKYMETMPTNRREHQLNVAMLKPKKLFKCSQCNFQSAFRWTVLKHLRSDHSNQSGILGDNQGVENVLGNSDSHIINQIDIDESIVKIEPGTTPPKSSSVLSISSAKSTSPGNFVAKPTVVSSSNMPVLSVPVISKLKGSKKDTKSSSDKPYMCPLCGKRTTFRGDVRKHYRYMHPGEEIRILYVGSLSNEEILTRTNEIKLTNPYISPIKKEKISTSQTTEKHSDINIHSSKQSPTDTTLILASDKLKDTPEHTTALEALYSNPKRVGYIKPFKCSACGRRSNWKWDLKKHIRERHPEGGYVIVMEEEEARLSLLAECYPNHPLVTKQKDGPATSDEFSSSSLTLVTSAAQRNAQKLWRQFECSGCGYKSNWRSDVYRHIKRRHNNNRSKVMCIDHKVSDYPPPFYFKFKKSEGCYEKKTADKLTHLDVTPDTESPSANNSVTNSEATATPDQSESITDLSSSSLLGHGKMWKCNKCTYRHKDKMLVLRHLTSHKVKPYKCKLCGHSSNYRSALYRHLRQKHGCNDYSLCKLSISYSADSEIGAASGEENDTDIGDLMDLYTCKICKFQSTWKACLYRHLRERHGTTDYNNCYIKLKSTQEGDLEENLGSDIIQEPVPERIIDRPLNKFQCNVCPYSTKKPTLLKFHMSYHKPRGQNRFKCKFCPYYVCARRLLNQHVRLHSNEHAKSKVGSKQANVSLKTDDFSSLSINIAPRVPSTKRMKFTCEKCPYATNSKNDFLYHKQFHRVKLSNSTAFKCDYCDYWVSHRRLLKQHLRLHIDPDQLSPVKTEATDVQLLYDAVEIASVKQKLIVSKILPSLSQSENSDSAIKIAARYATFGNKPGYILKNGVYKKLLKCSKCPYTNIRNRNLRLHELMHGRRSSGHPLLKCPHCDYFVGSKGLLSHHLKVHQHQYVPDLNDNTISELEQLEGISLEPDDDLNDKSDMEISTESKVDALLDIAQFKKFCCEKCPYASAKRTHFERHIELHGSKQHYTCEYCDYSVPSNNLLVQHRKLHFSPNPNLVATQSISNLQRLPEIPADVALASALPPLDSNDPVPLSVTHDHLDLYEHVQPEKDDSDIVKKVYHCDRCPYSNTRRDHMVTHLRFHVVRSELACPYCDYTVSKNHLLAQHVRVHFCPLPELSNWLNENGQKDRVNQSKEQDLSEALRVAQLYQQMNPTTVKNENDDSKDKDDSQLEDPLSTVCRYCDRSFSDTPAVLKHERQHLIGNQFDAFTRQSPGLEPATAVASG
ncbi:finger Xfin [Octopus vulgaris]|uniref:Finger Xfin n=1 Tax=Octopus vulgaris TaxID=6645 RepID=A0AA36BJC8_OCTVU|nr:finger Xfin [Octopus vulgaris]